MSGHPEAITETEAEVLAQVALPPPVADYGPVRLELMGHRYREGRLRGRAAGTAARRSRPRTGGLVEYYRPDAVYCITPGASPHVPLAAIPERFNDALDDSYDDDDEEGLF